MGIEVLDTLYDASVALKEGYEQTMDEIEAFTQGAGCVFKDPSILAAFVDSKAADSTSQQAEKRGL